MKISGFDKVTLLNYPDNVACTIFTKGCNFKCEFCHNSALINDVDIDLISEEEIFEYLNKRKNILDGVCISGGEPLLQPDIKEFIIKIKELGLKVKIDTNGSIPLVLKDLIDNNLIDYVAMDIKNIYKKYNDITKVKVNINNIKESIKIIENSTICYEFRTTIIKEFHTIDDIKNILSLISNKSKYYIQNFVNSDGVLNKALHGFSNQELLNMKECLKDYQNIIFRDI